MGAFYDSYLADCYEKNPGLIFELQTKHASKQVEVLQDVLEDSGTNRPLVIFECH
uniref:Uncharacterized protein n=1 Tax=Parascaris univalens TaxID=6257 RepID=A0A915A1S4_PARUN